MDPEKSMSTLATFPNKNFVENKDGKHLFTQSCGKEASKIFTRWGLSPPPGGAVEHLTDCHKMEEKDQTYRVVEQPTLPMALLSGISPAGSQLCSEKSNGKCFVTFRVGTILHEELKPWPLPLGTVGMTPLSLYCTSLQCSVRGTLLFYLVVA